jgi:hypothetical protein
MSQLTPMIYPNPGVVDMTLAFFEPTQNTPSALHSIGFNYNLEIYDMQNNLVISHTSDKQLINFPISTLQAGMYLVKVTDGVNEYIWRYIKS